VIFVTVGSSEPFDRLVRAVDEWAGLRGRSDVFAQIGHSDYQPKHIQCSKFLDPSEFRTRFNNAQFVVAHAGMGSIITALEIGKPIVVMPRRAHLGETRSDHQVATVD
jgi:UDP-N-acetylglucosamine transferase subunit ALG13